MGNETIAEPPSSGRNVMITVERVNELLAAEQRAHELETRWKTFVRRQLHDHRLRAAAMHAGVGGSRRG